MAAVSVELPDELSTQLHRMAERSGRSENEYVLEALQEHLGDIEDLEIARERLAASRAGESTTFSLDDVERELGLVD